MTVSEKEVEAAQRAPFMELQAIAAGISARGDQRTADMILDAARVIAAAQSDYEARILSALVPAPAQEGWTEEQLSRFAEALCAEDPGDPLRCSGPKLESVAKHVLDYVFRPGAPTSPEQGGE